MVADKDLVFTDSDGEVVEYDGSALSWRVSVYAVIVEDGKVLLVRGKGEKMYDLPGGGVKLGEKVVDALHREAMEEAGVVVEVGTMMTMHQDFFYHRKEKRFYQTLLLFFDAKRLSKQVKPTDSKMKFASFVKLKELEKFPMLSYVRDVIGGHPANENT